MALQPALSFGNGPFIVHEIARVHQKALGLPFREALAIRGADNEELLA